MSHAKRPSWLSRASAPNRTALAGFPPVRGIAALYFARYDNRVSAENLREESRACFVWGSP